MAYLIKLKSGYYAQRKIPEKPKGLRAAVAQVLNHNKPELVHLKRSLGTNEAREAKIRVKPVLMEFDRIVAAAEALLKERPVIKTLTEIQIKRIADVHYASILFGDEEERREGTGSEPLFQSIAKQLEEAGVEFNTPFAIGSLPEFGLSDREIVKRQSTLDYALPSAEVALARGNITHVREDMEELLSMFQLNLDRKSDAYRRLGMAVLSADVRGWRDVARRNAGEPIETPQAHAVLGGAQAHEGGTLREALEGWKKERTRPEDGVSEYERAVEMFIQLHGNLPIAKIKRPYAREYREALQLVPRTRSGVLLNAGLDVLAQWGREHPEAPRVSVGTVNKQLGAVQAIALWGFRNGLVPDDVSWTDQFQRMRLREERSTRGPFDAEGLKKIFAAPVFTKQEIPEGGKGAAAVWLPLLALFAGGRQAEFAGLRASDIREDPDTGTPLMWIVSDKKVERSLKNESSERVVPIHPELCKLGFLKFVDSRRREDGERAWLFPAIAPDQRGGLKAWSKWWGNYLRDHIGIEDRDMVFHSFRHGFTDRARAAGVSTEVRKAVMGHADNTVSGGYGAKNMLARWGVEVLKEAVEKISYPGLDLSRVKPLGVPTRTRATPRKN